MQTGSVAYTSSRGVFYHPPRATTYQPGAEAALLATSVPRAAARAERLPDGHALPDPGATGTREPARPLDMPPTPGHHHHHHQGSPHPSLVYPTASAAPLAPAPPSTVPVTAYSPLAQYLIQRSPPRGPLTSAPRGRLPTATAAVRVSPAGYAVQPPQSATTGAAAAASTDGGEAHCWLCGVACPDGPGSWAADGLGCAPALFYGPLSCEALSDEEAGMDASLRLSTRAWWSQYRLWISGLTLCTVCAVALDTNVRASADEVMQRARHTPTLSQHRLSFVNALREYKLLQDMIAERVLKAAQRFHVTVAARARPTSGEVGVPVACMTAQTSLWEAPPAVQRKVLHQLTQALEEMIAADEQAKAQLGRGQRGVPLTGGERHCLLQELAHVERQAQRLDKGEYARLKARLDAAQQVTRTTVPRGSPAQVASTRMTELAFDAADFLDTPAAETGETAEAGQGPVEPSPAVPPHTPSAVDPSEEAIASTPTMSAGMEGRVEATFWAAHHHHPQPHSASRERSMEDGGVHTPRRTTSATTTAAATRTAVPHDVVTDTRTLLTRYFDGSAGALPETTRLLSKTEAMASVVADSTPHRVTDIQRDLAGQSGLPTTEALLLPREGSASRNYPGELVLYPPETTTVEALVLALLETPSDAPGATSERTGQLVRALQGCVAQTVQDRRASDEAVLTAHGKVADLMKSANRMSETLLTHALSFTFRAHLQAMEALMSTRLNMMQSYCLQKSILFAEEMTTLVRLAQRRAYRLTLPVPTAKTPADTAARRSPDATRPIAPAVPAGPTSTTASNEPRRRLTEPFISASAPTKASVRTDEANQNFLQPHQPPGVDYQDWDNEREDEADQRQLTRTRPYR